jgi:hypothetical protein
MTRVLIAMALLCLPATSFAGTVRSRSGATAHVADSATGAFQCLVSRLDGAGYPIHFMGGWRRHGSVSHSLHPSGLALDINQYGRNVVRPHLPVGTTAMANDCGLIHGASWDTADAGHFQLGGWAGNQAYYANRRHRSHMARAR